MTESGKVKDAQTAYPIHPLLSQRWSPYGFADSDVSDVDLKSLFEAARWTQSSYNEQPWRFVVASRNEPTQYARALSCLLEGNQAWAKFAPVLAFGVISDILSYTGKPNAAAEHDLGAAAAALTMEASSRGICVHQMIGILPDKAKKELNIPDGFRALTALAIGYAGAPDGLDEQVLQRDSTARQRKPLSEIVFNGTFGQAWQG